MAITNIISSCKTADYKDMSKESLVPIPASVQSNEGAFKLTTKTQIIYGNDMDELKRISEYFAQLLRPATGFKLETKYNATELKGHFYFNISNDHAELGKEGYILNIDNDFVKLEASQPEGIFRGIQTIRQLLPPEIENQNLQKTNWVLAAGSISDYPFYNYRGSMLDVSRHFFNVDEVKRYIDWLARYKMNVLHLHLTDDQGWRIEIKKWPKLTEVGGSTEVGGGSGGYLTQKQYKELVKYASERYITIVPEIDMPGHTNAALASYAELNCDKKAKELYTGTEVGFSTLCMQNEIVDKFVVDVIAELAAITPGPYIHIGGDESHSTKEGDYIKFIEFVQDEITSHGKNMIGWDEIALTKLKPGSVAQYWDSNENALKAVSQGAKVIMSPANKAYLDMKYDSTTALGLSWAGYIEVNTAYNWDPEQLVAGIGKENIIGIECPLWSETVTNLDEISFMVFPRLLGYAEIGWSMPDNRNWEDYKKRISKQSPRFKAMGINHYASELIDWE